MRILYLCPAPHLGVRDRSGWSSHMLGVIHALRGQGHAVYPFLASGTRLPHRQGPDRSTSRSRALRALIPSRARLARRDLGELAHDLWLHRRIRDACRSFGPDVIYERTEVYHAAGLRVARRLGLPLVLEVNGPLVDERQEWAGLLLPGLARRIEAVKYAGAQAVVTVSTALADFLAAQGVERSRLHAIPNGADVVLFDPARAHPGAVRTQFGLGRRLVVGFVGAFADWHGLEPLVQAMADAACSRVLDLHLLMIGDGPSRPGLRRLAQRLGLDGRITLPGSVPHDQVPHYLAAMDICVLPSANWYMSPIKLFEYGAMGKAVIAPSTPAVCEVMSDGVDGLLVEPGDPVELAGAIRRLACHPEERRRLATTFQARVRQDHTWAMVAGRVSQLLEQSLRCGELALPASQAHAEGAG
jgi:glycosyltransferase involved in cell wall biosynthesis